MCPSEKNFQVYVSKFSNRLICLPRKQVLLPSNILAAAEFRGILLENTGLAANRESLHSEPMLLMVRETVLITPLKQPLIGPSYRLFCSRTLL